MGRADLLERAPGARLPEGATGAERANTMIGLQIMMPAGSWPPVPVRASSRHIRSWGDSGHAGHIGGTAALVEWPGGLSPPGSPRTVREPLDSYGSHCSAVSMA